MKEISAAQKIKDGKERKEHYPEPQADDGSPGKKQANFICKPIECRVLLGFHRLIFCCNRKEINIFFF
jgi:hypothetical protein